MMHTKDNPTPTQLFAGTASLYGSADGGFVRGVAWLTITTDDVELILVDGTTATGKGFRLTHADWSRVVELVDRSLSEPLPLAVTR